jgi:uncharacterized protein
MAYFDISVLVAFYCPEGLSEEAEKVILKDNEPMISMLSVVEFVSALSRKYRERTITAESAKSMWRLFDFHRTKGYYSVKNLEPDHYSSAASIIMQFKTPLRALDALHLAIADELSTRIITADVILAKSAEKLGIPHVLIR